MISVMVSPLVSVIVPVYNVSQYLERCVSSILEQTYSNIEVILVDDGSTDNSLSICREFEKRDSRVRVFAQNNRGPGSARNTGLNHAKGIYIAFVDSDDYVARTMIETLVSCSLEYNCDFVGAGVYLTDLCTGTTQLILHGKEYPYNIPIERNEILNILRTVHYGRNLLWYVCRNLFKKGLIDRITLRFSEENVIEDPLFNLEYLANANRAFLIEEPLYYYVQTPNSIMRKSGKKNYLRKLEDSSNLKIGIYKKYNIPGYEKSLADYNLNHTLTLLLSNLLELKEKEDLYSEVCALVESPMIRDAFKLGTLDSSTTLKSRVFRQLIRVKTTYICTLLIRIHQFLHRQ